MDTVEAPTQRNTALLFVLVLLSGTAHWLFLGNVLQFGITDDVIQQKHYTLDISLEPVAAKVVKVVENPAQENTAASSDQPSTNVPSNQKRQENSEFLPSTPVLKLGKEAMQEAIETTLQSPDHSGYTQSGAVVMNGSLLSTLNQSSQKIGPLNSTSPMTSFDGGSWSDFIKMGDKCFRVEAANPLDELSVEKWYRVACR